MGQILGQRPVVGQQQQPLRVQVQPPHRVHPDAAAGHQLRHVGASLFVRKGRHITSGFMEHHIAVLRRFGAEGDAADGDAVPLRVGFVAQGGGGAVDQHFPGGHQPLRLPAGADAVGG